MCQPIHDNLSHFVYISPKSEVEKTFDTIKQGLSDVLKTPWRWLVFFYHRIKDHRTQVELETFLASKSELPSDGLDRSSIGTFNEIEKLIDEMKETLRKISEYPHHPAHIQIGRKIRLCGKLLHGLPYTDIGQPGRTRLSIRLSEMLKNDFSKLLGQENRNAMSNHLTQGKFTEFLKEMDTYLSSLQEKIREDGFEEMQKQSPEVKKTYWSHLLKLIARDERGSTLSVPECASYLSRMKDVQASREKWGQICCKSEGIERASQEKNQTSFAPIEQNHLQIACVKGIQVSILNLLCTLHYFSLHSMATWFCNHFSDILHLFSLSVPASQLMLRIKTVA